jgi:hypothetical protein
MQHTIKKKHDTLIQNKVMIMRDNLLHLCNFTFSLYELYFLIWPLTLY